MHGNSQARLINIWMKQVARKRGARTGTTMQTAVKLYSLVVRLLWHTVEYARYISASQNVAISTVNVGVEERERKVIHSKECSWKEGEISSTALVVVNPFLASIVSRVIWLGGRFSLISVEDDHLLMCLFYSVIFGTCALRCLKKDKRSRAAVNSERMISLRWRGDVLYSLFLHTHKCKSVFDTVNGNSCSIQR